MRAGRRWVVAFAGVILLTALAAVAVLAAGSAMMAEADAYFGQFDFSGASGTIEVDQPEYDGYIALYSGGSTLAALGGPLFFCAIAAGVALLAVLSARRDAQAEAPAAS